MIFCKMPPQRKPVENFKFRPENHHPLPGDIPEGLWDLLCDCAASNPKDRPNFTEIRKTLADISAKIEGEPKCEAIEAPPRPLPQKNEEKKENEKEKEKEKDERNEKVGFYTRAMRVMGLDQEEKERQRKREQEREREREREKQREKEKIDMERERLRERETKQMEEKLERERQREREKKGREERLKERERERERKRKRNEEKARERGNIEERDHNEQRKEINNSVQSKIITSEEEMQKDDIGPEKEQRQQPQQQETQQSQQTQQPQQQEEEIARLKDEIEKWKNEAIKVKVEKKALKKRKRREKEDFHRLMMERMRDLAFKGEPWTEISQQEAAELKKKFFNAPNFLGRGGDGRGNITPEHNTIQFSKGNGQANKLPLKRLWDLWMMKQHLPL